MSRFFTRAAVTACLLATALSASAKQPLSDSGYLLDRVVAIVNDGVVLQSELDSQYDVITAQLRAQNTQLPPEDVIRKQILERLIVSRIQLQRAERIGIRISDDMVNIAIARIAERNGVALSELPQVMAAQGLSYARYREQMRQDIIIDKLRETEVDARVPVSRREVEQLIARQNEARSDVEFEISHILVAMPNNATPEELATTEAEAQDIYERLMSGEDFARLAVSYSAGQQALSGGKLGWRKVTELPTLFVDQVMDMDAGEISQPIRSGSGFHIVRVDDTRGAEKSFITQRHARHILIQPNEVVTDEEAKAKLVLLREEILGGADFGELAKENTDDTATATEMGDLGWAKIGTFVPAFEAVLDTLDEGELSEPFRSPFGWHIVELLGTRQYDNTEEVTQQRAYEQVWRRKLESEVELWVRRIRDEAFVEYLL
ncbi:MAG: peptidylprolyl isomerase SurA [Pseudomonadota bacterium]